jgi:hypothetical protein
VEISDWNGKRRASAGTLYQYSTGVLADRVRVSQAYQSMIYLLGNGTIVRGIGAASDLVAFQRTNCKLSRETTSSKQTTSPLTPAIWACAVVHEMRA